MKTTAEKLHDQEFDLDEAVEQRQWCSNCGARFDSGSSGDARSSSWPGLCVGCGLDASENATAEQDKEEADRADWEDAQQADKGAGWGTNS